MFRRPARDKGAVAAPLLASLILASVVQALAPRTALIADARTYDAIAQGLASDDSYELSRAVDGLGMRGYAYPLIIAAVYGIAGFDPGAVEWMQAAVFVPLTTLLIYLAGREAFSRRTGLIAAWLFALWLPAAWYSLWLTIETTLNLMAAILLALLAAALARGSPRLAILAGSASGLLSISHAAFQFLWIVLLVALTVYLWIRERRRFALAGFFALGTAAIILPYMVFTAAAHLPHLGEGARGYGGGGGWTFWIGSRWQTDFTLGPGDYEAGDLYGPGALVELGKKIDQGRVHVEPHLLKTIRAKLARPDAEQLTLTDGDYYRAGLENLLDRPGKWPRKLGRNAETLFLVPRDLNFLPEDPLPSQTWFRPLWRPLSAMLAVLSLAGLFYVLARRRDDVILVVPLVFQLLLLMVTHADYRYIIPLWSSMFLLAGAALAALPPVRAAPNRERR